MKPARPAGLSLGPYNLLKRFSWLSLICIVVVFSVFSILLSRFLTDSFIYRDAVLTMEFLQSVEDAENDTAYRSGGRPELRDRRVEQFLERVSRLPDVLRANIYTRDRRVIWSSDLKIADTVPTENPELDSALAGKLHVELRTAEPDDPKPEHADLSDRSARFVELYVPLRNNRTGEVVGVAELYRVPVSLFDTINRGIRMIWTLAALGALLLYGTLFWIVRRADRTIRTQRDRLIETERFAAVGELTAAVAHGIRNPLASIRSSAELCHDSAAPGTLSATRDIIDEVDNMERWVRDLLAYSDPGRFGPGSVDLGAVIARAEAAFRRECERRRIALETDLPSGLPAVVGDEALFEQVFCSLFSNALEAMPDGGKLRIAALLAGHGDTLRVTVSDTGHGIASAHLSRLFTPYATTKPNGMGLGLSLVRHIIRRFGGEVRVESWPQRGTHVILDLSPAEA